MKARKYFLIGLILAVTSCTSELGGPSGDRELTEYEVELIDYFKEIALGFEFGNASKLTRFWNTRMNIYVGGQPGPELINELKKIYTEINELAGNGFEVQLVEDSIQSNYYIFFGAGKDYAAIFPQESNLVDSNWGLFRVFWNEQNKFTSGRMYVDISRANPLEQMHLLREELTQSLGLAQDSPKYPESIFQSDWTRTTEYAVIDKDLIRLLYHPDMIAGLDEFLVEPLLKEILLKD